MPSFAYIGTQPLRKDDKICGAIRYTATGKDLFDKVLKYHEKTYLDKKWNPAKMRMLVVKKIKNRSFSTSGSVSSSWSDTTADTLTSNIAPNTLNRNTSSTLYGSGSIAPSFSQSWVAESFDIWFFLID